MEGLDDGSDSDGGSPFGQGQDHDSDSGEVDHTKLLEEAGAVLEDLDKETAERAKGVFQYVKCKNGVHITNYIYLLHFVSLLFENYLFLFKFLIFYNSSVILLSFIFVFQCWWKLIYIW